RRRHDRMALGRPRRVRPLGVSRPPRRLSPFAPGVIARSSSQSTTLLAHCGATRAGYVIAAFGRMLEKSGHNVHIHLENRSCADSPKDLAILATSVQRSSIFHALIESVET